MGPLLFTLIQLRKAWKIKLIISAEFFAKGYPTPHPHPPFIFSSIFFKKYFIALKWSTCCETDSVWYGKFIWVYFDTFTEVRECDQYPGRMLGVGLEGWFLCLYFFTCFKAFLTYFHSFIFFVGKINYFYGWGVSPPIRRKVRGNN